jgi:hypothetical protein
MSTTIVWTNSASVIAAAKKWPLIFADEIVWTLRLAAELLASGTKELAPVGVNGDLRRSIMPDAEPARIPGVGFSIGWGTMVEYGQVIEEGRTPGARMPPIDPIAAWVWGRREKFPDVKTEEDAFAVAWNIARGIKHHGFTSGPVAGKHGGRAWGMFSRAAGAKKSTVIQLFKVMRDRIATRCSSA